ncbi:ring finger domain protein [Diplodia corticola]|uniref:RING-type E3 ubiquitin transferase n=1 Tax=Diplodia corticola TaxID=236234 RepID=A0A1J9R2L5_9PEZI|nr:ring finger domain protein [Diplodia corticola]OJD34482.1 ring finger domain protein [Diplodia corticola]
MSTPQTNREMVFCHQCENEWYRDEHGLTCPDCHSEFTEIIEPDHDPRDDHLDPEDEFEEEANPFALHNPWNAPDPEEGVPEPIQGAFPPGIRLQRNGPNSYSITGTWSTSFGGARSPLENQGEFGEPNAFVNPLFRNFASMMQGIAGGQPRANHGEQEHGESEGQPGSSAREETRSGSGPHYTYTSTARLFPRDANNPGPHVEPTDSLHEVIAGILGGGAFGPPPFAQNRQHGPGSPGGEGGVPPNPLATLFASLLNPQLAAHGDAVYSQEALDRVISQLMEQNATGNAPGPASAAAIAALPKKRVTREMVGAGDSPPDFPESELHGECSICMDEVPIGAEVTELPCGHWFHGQCIEAWLGEHDTCPHCRKGIEKKENQDGQQGGNGPSGGAAGSSGSGSAFGPGSGSLGNNSGNDNNNGGGSTNNPDDHFVPNMPGGLYSTSFYSMGAPRSQTRSPFEFPLFGIPHAVTFPQPPFAASQDSSGQPPMRDHRYSHRNSEPFMRIWQGALNDHDRMMHNGGESTHVIIVRPQRRRHSFSRVFSNVGHSMTMAAGSGGGERPGIGERLRSLFRS